MKDISVKSSQKTETIDFGPVGRDILLDKKIEKETLRAQTKEAELEAAITTVTTSITDVLVDGQSVVENKVANIDSYHRTIVLSLDKIESYDPLLFNPSAEDLATLNNDKVETIKLDNQLPQLPIEILPERSVWIRRTGIKNISGYGDVIIFDAESNNFRQNEDQSIELYKLGTTEVIYITSGPYANKCLILTNTVDVAWQLKRLDNFESDIADHRTQISQLWDKTAGMETEYRGKDAQIEQSLADTKAELQAKDAELDNRIDSVEQRGRYLSLWNASTGLPVSDPASIPYAYKPGDYYIVKYVAEEGGINYRPDGSQYTGVASTVEETDELHIDNTYYYDGTEWSLQAGGASVIPWGKITGDIADQEDLSNALAAKANDSAVIHKTGQESIAGYKMFVDGLRSDGKIDIGTASGTGSIQYNAMYKYFTFNVGATRTVSITTTALRPESSSNPINLGTSAYGFKKLYLNQEVVTPTGSGNAGQVLTSGGSDNAMTWSDAPSGGKSLYYHETQMTIDGTTYWVSVISTDGNSKASQLFTTAFNYQNFVHIVNIQPLNQLPDRCYIGGYRNNLVKKFICLKYSDNSIMEMNVNNVRITSDTVYEM